MAERVYYTHNNGGRPFRVAVRPQADGAFEVTVDRNQLLVEEALAAAARRLQGPPLQAVRHYTVEELLALRPPSANTDDGAAETDANANADANADADADADADEYPDADAAEDDGERAGWPGTQEAAAPAGPDGRAPGAAGAEAAAAAADEAASPGRDADAAAGGWWGAPPAGPGLRLRALEVLVGRSRAGWPGADHFDPADEGEFAGNTLLLRLDPADAPGWVPNYAGRGRAGVPYAFVGGTAVRLLSLPEAVTAFYSPVGHSDVPYPVAITPTRVVALWERPPRVLPRAAFGPAPTVGDLIGQKPFLDVSVGDLGTLFRAVPAGADSADDSANDEVDLFDD